jgi:hypothetical protein
MRNAPGKDIQVMLYNVMTTPKTIVLKWNKWMRRTGVSRIQTAEVRFLQTVMRSDRGFK